MMCIIEAKLRAKKAVKRKDEALATHCVMVMRQAACHVRDILLRYCSVSGIRFSKA